MQCSILVCDTFPDSRDGFGGSRWQRIAAGVKVISIHGWMRSAKRIVVGGGESCVHGPIAAVAHNYMQAMSELTAGTARYHTRVY